MRTRSVAPAEAFTAAPVTGAAPRSGMITPCAAQHLRAAHHRAQVVGIGDAVEQHQQRRLVRHRRRRQHRRPAWRSGYSPTTATMPWWVEALPASSAISARGPQLDGDAAIAGHLHRPVDLARLVALGDVDHRHLARPRPADLLDRANAEHHPPARLPRVTRRLDLARRSRRTPAAGDGRVADRPPDHQVVGARRDGRRRRGHPLLVAQRRARRPHARDHQQQLAARWPAPRRSRGASRPARRSPPAPPARARRATTSATVPRDAVGLQVLRAQAGQHRHAQRSSAWPAAASAARRQHLRAARGVHGQQLDAQRRPPTAPPAPPSRGCRAA